MKAFTIGRHSDNDFVIDNPSVSGKHAKIEISEDFKSFKFIDLDSSNGSFVDENEVLQKKISIANHIKLGSYQVNSKLLFEKLNVFIHDNRTDFSKEFVRLKSVEENYKNKKRNLKRDYQIRTMLIRFGFVALILVAIYFLDFEFAKDQNTLLRIGAALFGVASILTFIIPIEKKLEELQEDLQVKYVHDFVCPKCKKELFQRGYKYWHSKKNCPSCKCKWVELK